MPKCSPIDHGREKVYHTAWMCHTLQYSGYGGDWVQLIHQEGEEKATMMLDGKFFRAVDRNCWCVEERLRDMDKTGES